MNTTLFSTIYFTLGLAPSLFFGARFYIQWIASERKKQSYTPEIFWRLSFIGNLLSIIHYWVQLQLPFLLIQCVNGFISWRHISLKNKKKIAPFRKSVFHLGLILCAVMILHWTQLKLWDLDIPLFDGPLAISKQSSLSLIWVTVGSLGTLLFGSRFLIQWWQTEHSSNKRFSLLFWLLSIAGGVLCLIYSIKIKDTVSCVNFGLGLIPYTRNILLIYKEKTLPIKGKV
jgi:lipid-A-disaccharide synthase-like uncharacterized protein